MLHPQEVAADIHHVLIHIVHVLVLAHVHVPAAEEQDVLPRTFIRPILNLITLRKIQNKPIYYIRVVLYTK